MTWHPDMPEEYRNKVVLGDHKELAKNIPDNSINLLYCDPPYPREFISVFYEMGEYAPRVMKDGASLITLCGHYQVPNVIEAMKDLSFHWMGWVLHSGPKRTLFGYRVVCGGKPLLWFAKGKVNIKRGFWWDTKESGGRDKNYHEWGQPVGYVVKDITLLTNPEDTVLDPFCGGGQTAAACIITNRNFVTFELNPDTFAIANRRVMTMARPLFVPEYEQSGMEELVDQTDATAEFM